MSQRVDGNSPALALSQLQLTDRTYHAEPSSSAKAASLPITNPFALAYSQLELMDKEQDRPVLQSSGMQAARNQLPQSNPFSLAFAQLGPIIDERFGNNGDAESSSSTHANPPLSTPYSLAYAQLELMDNSKSQPSSPSSETAPSPSVSRDGSPGRESDVFDPMDAVSDGGRAAEHEMSESEGFSWSGIGTMPNKCHGLIHYLIIGFHWQNMFS